MNILILSPHTDDGELGCGGTIAKLLEMKHVITMMYFSYCGNDKLIQETKKANQILGITKSLILKFKVRNFPKQRQEILQTLYDFQKESEVDIVFTPTTTDLHQDHQVITNEAMRAFRRCTVLGYELPWNNVRVTTNCFISLEKHHVDRKIEALACYESQKHNYYFNPSFFQSVLRTRGTQMGTYYAEAFEVLKIVMDNFIK